MKETLYNQGDSKVLSERHDRFVQLEKYDQIRLKELRNLREVDTQLTEVWRRLTRG